MLTKLRLITLCVVAMLCVGPRSVARQPVQSGTDAIACRVIESHANASPAATVVIFHQQHKGDQERLGALLRAHSGEGAEIQISGAIWSSVTIFRLKSCFGRGLMVLPRGAPEMKEGTVFLLWLPVGNAKN
ncbi:MAG TPA: hypothetical protein VEI08_00695 [Candidatus Bathyarchaeia archaeon]|nr:hypothetical protein [Candidatus Bathyarchaeia archaeon]